MSNFKGHIIGGVAAGIGISAANFYFKNPLQISSEFYPVLFGSTLFGAMFPDTDIGSTSRKYIYFIFLLAAGYFFIEKQYYHCGIIGLFAILPAISSHRGWTHSKLAMIGIPAAVVSFLVMFNVPFNLLYACYLYCVSGYASHLFLDRKLF